MGGFLSTTSGGEEPGAGFPSWTASRRKLTVPGEQLTPISTYVDSRTVTYVPRASPLSFSFSFGERHREHEMLAAWERSKEGPGWRRAITGTSRAVGMSSRGATARARGLDWAGADAWGARYLKGTRSLETTSNQPIHDGLKPVVWQ